jgi:hypothetical protein
MGRIAPYSGITGRVEARASLSAGKGFDDPIQHSCDVHVLLLSVLLRRAGVFAGLDSESESIPNDPPARRRGGFFVFCALQALPRFANALRSRFRGTTPQNMSDGEESSR